MAGLRAVRIDYMKCGCSILRVDRTDTGERVGVIDEQCDNGLGGPEFVGLPDDEALHAADYEGTIGEVLRQMAVALGLNPEENEP